MSHCQTVWLFLVVVYLSLLFFRVVVVKISISNCLGFRKYGAVINWNGRRRCLSMIVCQLRGTQNQLAFWRHLSWLIWSTATIVVQLKMTKINNNNKKGRNNNQVIHLWKIRARETKKSFSCLLWLPTYLAHLSIRVRAPCVNHKVNALKLDLIFFSGSYWWFSKKFEKRQQKKKTQQHQTENTTIFWLKGVGGRRTLCDFFSVAVDVVRVAAKHIITICKYAFKY